MIRILTLPLQECTSLIASVRGATTRHGVVSKGVDSLAGVVGGVDRGVIGGVVSFSFAFRRLFKV